MHRWPRPHGESAPLVRLRVIGSHRLRECGTVLVGDLGVALGRSVTMRLSTRSTPLSERLRDRYRSLTKMPGASDVACENWFGPARSTRRLCMAVVVKSFPTSLPNTRTQPANSPGYALGREGGYGARSAVGRGRRPGQAERRRGGPLAVHESDLGVPRLLPTYRPLGKPRCSPLVEEAVGYGKPEGGAGSEVPSRWAAEPVHFERR